MEHRCAGSGAGISRDDLNSRSGAYIIPASRKGCTRPLREPIPGRPGPFSRDCPVDTHPGLLQTAIHAPVRRAMPVWFGGHVDQTFDRIARMGDGWITLQYKPDADGRAAIGGTIQAGSYLECLSATFVAP